MLEYDPIEKLKELNARAWEQAGRACRCAAFMHRFRWWWYLLSGVIIEQGVFTLIKGYYDDYLSTKVLGVIGIMCGMVCIILYGVILHMLRDLKKEYAKIAIENEKFLKQSHYGE
jgi:hypothetical protein